jgi:hypothetical protein
MNVKLFFILLMAYAVHSSGQGSVDTSFLSIPKKKLKQVYSEAFKYQTSLVSGSAYAEYKSIEDEHPFLVNDDWFMGSIIYNGTFYEGVPLQFDIQSQKVLLEHPASAKKIELVKENILSFTLDGRHFITLTDQTVNGLEDRFGFYEILVDGKTTLLCRRIKSLQQNFSAGRVYPVFHEINKFYLMHDRTVSSLKSKRVLLRLLGSIDAAAAAKVRKQRIRYAGRKEQGFADAVKAFNESL